jgi:transcriptional regulator with XRE-family HTH domain
MFGLVFDNPVGEPSPTFHMAVPLHNYLRTYRKRSGLSQDEVGFLLGVRHGTKVSRYERSARTPGLDSVLAYELVFGVPARRLFAGIFRKVETVTIRRAKALIRRLSPATRNALAARKLALLQAIASGSASGPGQRA